jgi:type VI secretion system secreted protein Hcp
MRVSRTYVLVVCFVLLAVPVFAASNSKGDTSPATVSLDGFQALSAMTYSFGISNTISDSTGGGGGAGKATLSDFTFTKTMDASSSKLFKSCASGSHIKQGQITVRDAKGNTLNQITLTDVLVRSVQTSSDGNTVTESISLTYAKIEFSF